MGFVEVPTVLISVNVKCYQGRHMLLLRNWAL